MRQEKIIAAKKEAERFLERVEALIERHAKDEQFRKYFEICGHKETAALKRSSMDLTRALSEMRKP